MQVKEKRYLVYLSQDCRRRHYHRYLGKWVTGFTVQLEILIAGQWYPVIRYDTSHGFSHRDFIHPDGTVEKISINANTFNEALTFSENDLKAHWQFYQEQFLKEVRKNDG